MLISVVVPVFNAEKFLDRSITSVISQSYKNWELLLIDDGSKDNSRKICEGYAANDDRIKVLIKENSGPAAARNFGVQNSKGDFIFFLDADDFIEINSLKVLVEEFQKNDTDLVMGNFSKLVLDGRLVKQTVSFHPGQTPFNGNKKILTPAETANFVRHFLKFPSNHLVSYCWARLYKSSIIKEYKITANSDMNLFEDFVFNLEYLKHVRNMVFVNESIYTYVMHDNHVSVSMGILNGDSLIHDMQIFWKSVEEYFQAIKSIFKEEVVIQKEIGHALIHYAIIFFIRTCRLLNDSNKEKIHNEINKVIQSSIFKESLQYYSPSKGNSRILPILAKLQFVNLTISYCRWKAYKRYGKPGTA